MNLILWRHAEAIDLGTPVTPGCKRDLERKLTDRGQIQAADTARWLRKRPKRLATPPRLLKHYAHSLMQATCSVPSIGPRAKMSLLLDTNPGLAG